MRRAYQTAERQHAHGDKYSKCTLDHSLMEGLEHPFDYDIWGASIASEEWKQFKGMFIHNGFLVK